MDTEPSIETVPAAPRRRGTRVAVAAGLTVFLAFVGAGVAFAVGGSGHPTTAATGGSSGSGSGSGGAEGPSGSSGKGHLGFGHAGPAGFGAMGLGMAGMSGLVHGQGVVKDGTGYQTYDFQSGTVQTVSAGSIQVKSADGFVATYVIGSSTKVDGKTGGVAQVAKGDTVEVVALVSGRTATVTTLLDPARFSAGRHGFGTGHWGGGPKSPSSTTSSTVGAPA